MDSRMTDAAPQITGASSQEAAQREWTFDKFRRWGYLVARLDPLGFFSPPSQPELDGSGEWAAEARIIYCQTIGADFMHVADPERRKWIALRMEAPSNSKPDRERILERLIRTELFEQTLQTRFVGTKRYSIEGLAVLIPLLDQIVEASSAWGVEQLVL